MTEQMIDNLPIPDGEELQSAAPLETYHTRKTPEALETVRLVSTRKTKRAIWLTLMFYIGMMLLDWVIDGSLLTCFVGGVGAATVLIQWRILHDNKKRMVADMARITENEYLTEVFEDGYRVTITRGDREDLRLFTAWDEVKGAWKTPEYLIFYDRTMIHHLPIADIAPDSRLYTALSDKISPVQKQRAPSNTQQTAQTVTPRLQSVCKLFTALTILALVAAFIMFPSMIWALSRYAIPLYALLLIFPIGSFVCGVVCTRRGGKGKSNRDLGIAVAIVITLVGVGTLAMSGWVESAFSKDSVQAYELAQKADIALPPALDVVYSVQTPELELTDSNAFTRVYYHAELVLDAEAEAFFEQIRHDPRWVHPLPTELRGALPDTAETYTGTTDYVLFYRMTDDSYNRLPAEDGSYRYLCFIYRPNSGLLDIYHYDLIHEAS